MFSKHYDFLKLIGWNSRTDHSAHNSFSLLLGWEFVASLIFETGVVFLICSPIICEAPIFLYVLNVIWVSIQFYFAWSSWSITLNLLYRLAGPVLLATCVLIGFVKYINSGSFFGKPGSVNDSCFPTNCCFNDMSFWRWFQVNYTTSSQSSYRIRKNAIFFFFTESSSSKNMISRNINHKGFLIDEFRSWIRPDTFLGSEAARVKLYVRTCLVASHKKEILVIHVPL